MATSVIRWSGEVDVADVARERELIERALGQAGLAELVIDLCAVTFLDSSALSLLIVSQRHAASRGVAFRVRHAQGSVRKLFLITGTLAILQ